MRRKLFIRIGLGFIGILLLIGLAVFIASLLFSDTVPTNDLIVANSNKALDEPQLTFPILNGVNLEFTEQTIPGDLKSSLNLIVVAYTVDQQEDVEAWLPYLEDLNADYPDLAGYYVPILPKDTADSALFIIGGMALYASGEEDRQRTIVVFSDVEAFNEVLVVEGTDNIRLFLVDKDGQVFWQNEGVYTAEKFNNLADTLAQLEQ